MTNRFTLPSRLTAHGPTPTSFMCGAILSAADISSTHLTLDNALISDIKSVSISANHAFIGIYVCRSRLYLAWACRGFVTRAVNNGVGVGTTSKSPLVQVVYLPQQVQTSGKSRNFDPLPQNVEAPFQSKTISKSSKNEDRRSKTIQVYHDVNKTNNPLPRYDL